MTIVRPPGELFPPMAPPDFAMSLNGPTVELPLVPAPGSHGVAPPVETPVSTRGAQLRKLRGLAGTAATKLAVEADESWHGGNQIIAAIEAGVTPKIKARDEREATGPITLSRGQVRRDLKAQGLLEGQGFLKRRRTVREALCAMVRHGSWIKRPEGYVPTPKRFSEYYSGPGLK